MFSFFFFIFFFFFFFFLFKVWLYVQVEKDSEGKRYSEMGEKAAEAQCRVRSVRTVHSERAIQLYCVPSTSVLQGSRENQCSRVLSGNRAGYSVAEHFGKRARMGSAATLPALPEPLRHWLAAPLCGTRLVGGGTHPLAAFPCVHPPGGIHDSRPMAELRYPRAISSPAGLLILPHSLSPFSPLFIRSLLCPGFYSFSLSLSLLSVRLLCPGQGSAAAPSPTLRFPYSGPSTPA